MKEFFFLYTFQTACLMSFFRVLWRKLIMGKFCSLNFFAIINTMFFRRKLQKFVVWISNTFIINIVWQKHPCVITNDNLNFDFNPIWNIWIVFWPRLIFALFQSYFVRSQLTFVKVDIQNSNFTNTKKHLVLTRKIR